MSQSQPTIVDSQSKRALVLRIVEDQVKEFRSSELSISIGSDPSCTVRISSSEVKSVHCLIVRDEDTTLIRNWATNTTLNGAPFDDEHLQDGDVIRVADIEIHVGFEGDLEVEPHENPEPAEVAISESAELDRPNDIVVTDNSDQSSDFAAAFDQPFIGQQDSVDSQDHVNIQSEPLAFEPFDPDTREPEPAASSDDNANSLASDIPDSESVEPIELQQSLDRIHSSLSQTTNFEGVESLGECEDEPQAGLQFDQPPTGQTEAPASMVDEALDAFSDAGNEAEDPFEQLKRISSMQSQQHQDTQDSPTEEASAVAENVQEVLQSNAAMTGISEVSSAHDLDALPSPGSSPPESPVSDSAGKDASIEEYMQQLLQRNGVDGGAIATPAVVHEEQTVEEPSVEREKSPKQKPHWPRVEQLEKPTDLTALRELAKESTQTAITRYARSTRNQRTLTLFLGAIATALGGLILITLSNFDRVLFMLSGFAMLGGSVYLMLQSIKAGIFTKIGFNMRPKEKVLPKRSKPRRRRRRR